MAEEKVLETNPLCVQVIDFVEVRITLLSNPMRASKCRQERSYPFEKWSNSR